MSGTCQTDERYITEMTMERAKIAFQRVTPWQFEMTVNRAGETQRFTYQSSDEQTPLRMWLSTNTGYDGEVNDMSVTGSLRSAKVSDHHQQIVIRAGLHGVHEVTVDFRSDRRSYMSITCVEATAAAGPSENE